MTDRPDEPRKVKKHEGRYNGGVALIVLGGPSGKDWKEIRRKVAPNVVISVNGGTFIPADYWLLTENMNFCNNKRNNDEYLAGFLHVLDPHNSADNLFISHRSANLIEQYGLPKEKCTKIRRHYYDNPYTFSFREYRDGFWSGPISNAVMSWKSSVKVRLGTVGMQALHLAGILGCKEVHTIGFDLKFERDKHHWYEHPKYKAGRFRRDRMFETFMGELTQTWWIETAYYLATTSQLFERDGLEWVDHSNGLLKRIGAWCAA